MLIQCLELKVNAPLAVYSQSEEVDVSEGSNPVSVTFNKPGDNVKVDTSGVAGVTVTDFVVKMCAEGKQKRLRTLTQTPCDSWRLTTLNELS